MRNNNPMGCDATKHDFPDVGELNLHETTDAALWADQFNQMAMYLGYAKMDEGWLLGWFANAICAGRDAESRAKDAEIERLRAVIMDLAIALNENLDDDPCWTDHHGYCQAHHLDDTKEDGCRVENGRKLYEKIKAEFIEGHAEQALKGDA